MLWAATVSHVIIENHSATTMAECWTAHSWTTSCSAETERRETTVHPCSSRTLKVRELFVSSSRVRYMLRTGSSSAGLAWISSWEKGGGEKLLNLSIVLPMSHILSHTLSSLFLSPAQLLSTDVPLAPEKAVSLVGWWLPVVGQHWTSLPTNSPACSTGRAHTHTPGSHGASSATCHELNAPESHSILPTPNR